MIKVNLLYVYFNYSSKLYSIFFHLAYDTFTPPTVQSVFIIVTTRLLIPPPPPPPIPIRTHLITSFFSLYLHYGTCIHHFYLCLPIYFFALSLFQQVKLMVTKPAVRGKLLHPNSSGNVIFSPRENVHGIHRNAVRTWLIVVVCVCTSVCVLSIFFFLITLVSTSASLWTAKSQIEMTFWRQL